jgi:hypothetical protein
MFSSQTKKQIEIMKTENYKSYKESLELYNSGAKLPNPTAYWVDLKDYGKGRGFELMSAEQTESVYDGCSFVEIETTIPAYPSNFNN